MKILLITNIPAPYRLPIYAQLAHVYGDNFLVIYAAKTEANREWKMTIKGFNHRFLHENSTAKKDGFNYVHNNLDVWYHLWTFNPDVVITTGFNPTHLYGWLYSVVMRKKHIPMSDGWSISEEHLSWLHTLIRKMVYKTSHAFIGASRNTLDLFRAYHIPQEALFQSHLCIDNDRFKTTASFEERHYHLMFSGQFTHRKLPLFFAEVARAVSEHIPDLKLLILGNGPLKEEFFTLLDNYHLTYHYAGFVDQKELPSHYGDAKLFLFPTLLDPWGVVANEAMASGTPIITTPFAGVVNDLVIDGETGFILPVDVEVWSTAIVSLLNHPTQWKKLSQRGQFHVQAYNFTAAAQGIHNACTYAYAH
jgi:glycosyltransferase involved in cell wall biosynthesis